MTRYEFQTLTGVRDADLSKAGAVGWYAREVLSRSKVSGAGYIYDVLMCRRVTKTAKAEVTE